MSASQPRQPTSARRGHHEPGLGLRPLYDPRSGAHAAAMTRRVLTALEVLPVRECLRLLGTVRIGRVVMCIDGTPAVVPVAFAVNAEAVHVHTHPETRLARAARAGSRVTFEADVLDPAGGVGWSVVVTGPAHVVTDGAEHARGQAGLAPIAPVATVSHVAIALGTVTGRRIVHEDAGPV